MNYTTSEVYLERMVSEVKPEWIQDSSNRAVFEMIKEINSVSDFKISFITLREDFSQSNNSFKMIICFQVNNY